MKTRLALATLILLGFAGAVYVGMFSQRDISISPAEHLPAPQAGTLLSAQRTLALPHLALRALLASIDLPVQVFTESGFTTYRMTYLSTGVDGSLVPLSALVAVPHRDQIAGAVAYFHGTVTQRTNAPSQPGLGEGLLVAAAVSGAGFVMVAPDYIGLGESEALHPYLHLASTVSTSLDALLASRTLLARLGMPWPPALYLTGASQGGHATLAVQHALQQASGVVGGQHFNVAGSAPIVAPLYLREISFPQAMRGLTDAHVFYLAYLSTAYAQIYQQPLGSLLNPHFAAQLPKLFDGSREIGEIMDALPDAPQALFTPAFLNAFEQGGDHWFLQALQDNSIPLFVPQAPVQFFIGEADVDVLPMESERMAAWMAAAGAAAGAAARTEVQVRSVGPYSHNQAAIRGLPLALSWFRELSASYVQRSTE